MFFAWRVQQASGLFPIVSGMWDDDDDDDKDADDEKEKLIFPSN